MKPIDGRSGADGMVVWERWRQRRRRLAAASLAVAALLAGTARPTDVRVTDVRVTDVRVTNAWIRWLPAGLPGAGYMTLTNDGSSARVLTGASSPMYSRVEMHRSRSSGGLNTMVPVAVVDLPPHTTVAFGEGGYHLMLLQPTRAVHPGEQVPVILEFADRRTLTVPFAVRGPPAASQ